MPQQKAAWLLAPPLAAFALLAWKLDFLCDDAFISFRYARNLAEGQGLRFNLTESPPVEGYTNFLWVLWVALAEVLGIEPGTWARASSALCGALLVAWVTRHAARRFALDPVGTLATGLFVATLPPIALWATGGLETMASALCVFGVYERLLGDPERPRGRQAGVLAALAGLLRADGALSVGLLLGGALLVWLREGRPRPLARAILRSGGLLALAVGAHLLWRLSYYGELLPNTAHLKAGVSAFRLGRGLDYVASFFLALPALLLLLAAAPRGLRGASARVWIAPGVLVLCTFLYAIWVGGDFMPLGRFLLPAVPFFALFFASAWCQLAAGGHLRLARVLATLCIALSVAAAFDRGLFPESWLRRFHYRVDRPFEREVAFSRSMHRRAEEWSLLGRALAHCARPGESIVLGGIGAVGYHSRLEIFDTYGLVSPEVARRGTRVEGTAGHDVRVDPDFFFDRRPTYMGAYIARSDAGLLDGLPSRWPQSDYNDLVRIERCPLPEELGFEPGTELRLLRLLYESTPNDDE